MSIVIQSGFVVSDSVSGGGVINADNPLIGYANLITAANIAATTEADGFPASNVANVSTVLRWQGEDGSPAADEYLTATINAAEPVDYIAVARHNLGSAQIAVSVEYLDTDASPDTWEELIAPVILPNDGPALFRFAPAALSQIRIRMQPGSEAPTIAVLYCGALLVLQRRIYVGHTPVNYGRSANIVNARSEAGDFLGRIVLSETTATGVSLKNITPSWFRSYLNPFILDSVRRPFFFAWRPSGYPREVGYVWMTNDPQPLNELTNGMMSIDLQMSGIV
jgi:hypothetical protein